MTLQKARNLSSRLYACCGRALLALIALLLVVMPWTEYFCNFDKFLRGGQDLEWGLSCVFHHRVLGPHRRPPLHGIGPVRQTLA